MEWGLDAQARAKKKPPSCCESGKWQHRGAYRATNTRVVVPGRLKIEAQHALTGTGLP
jgi:hypothetical protein